MGDDIACTCDVGVEHTGEEYWLRCIVAAKQFRVDAVPTRTAGRQDGDQPRRGDIRVRLKIIRNELIKNVGKFRPCMFSKLRILFKRIVAAESLSWSTPLRLLLDLCCQSASSSSVERVEMVVVDSAAPAGP